LHPRQLTPNETLSRIPEERRRAGWGTCSAADSRKPGKGFSLPFDVRFKLEEQAASKRTPITFTFYGSRDATAERVPHPTRPAWRGSAGIRDGVSLRWPGGQSGRSLSVRTHINTALDSPEPYAIDIGYLWLRRSQTRIPIMATMGTVKIDAAIRQLRPGLRRFEL